MEILWKQMEASWKCNGQNKVIVDWKGAHKQPMRSYLEQTNIPFTTYEAFYDEYSM